VKTLKENAMSVSPEIIAAPDKEYEIVDGHPEEKEMGGARHSGLACGLLFDLDHMLKRIGLVVSMDPTLPSRLAKTSDCRMPHSS